MAGPDDVSQADPVLGRRSGWVLTLYPGAGEAGGSLLGSPRGVAGRSPADPDRSAAEAGRRARGQIRRYCAANRLNRLGTLTYAGAGCHDPAALRVDVAAFFKSLRRGIGGEAIPYLWVPEWHPGGHGLHVHFAVGRYVAHTLIRDAWGRGRVHIKLLGDLPVGSGSLEEARLAARYLAKYAGKALDEGRPVGRHRYEVAQGFQPASVAFSGGSSEHVIGQAAWQMGAEPDYVWRSSTEEGWLSPPSVWVAWSG